MTHITPTPHHLEALLDGAIAAGLCPGLRGCVPATGEVLPAQYLLLTRDDPRARTVLRRAAEALLALLDAADAAYAGGDPDGCARFRALAAAPPWLLRPSAPQDTDVDVALVWERQVDHDGDWNGLLEALHRAGSVRWQWAIRRCRALMRFERETGIDLAGLVGCNDENHQRRGAVLSGAPQRGHTMTARASGAESKDAEHAEKRGAERTTRDTEDTVKMHNEQWGNGQ